MIRQLGWYWFLSGKETLLDERKCGKWMIFFDDQDFAIKTCQKAIDQEVAYECKCTDMENSPYDSGVICFYANCDDIDNHRKIIEFLKENDLIQKTKTGRLYNLSFKLDDQTRAGEYGSDFEGKIRLAQFIDLKTGEWIYE